MSAHTRDTLVFAFLAAVRSVGCLCGWTAGVILDLDHVDGHSRHLGDHHTDHSATQAAYVDTTDESANTASHHDSDSDSDRALVWLALEPSGGSGGTGGGSGSSSGWELTVSASWLCWHPCC